MNEVGQHPETISNVRKGSTAHYALVAHLIKTLIADRFKRMAKDEVLFKFLTTRVDPAVLVDFHLQAERSALDLAEMSLLTLVDSEKMNSELRRSAEHIQNNFQNIFRTDASENFVAETLVDHRMHWLRGRIHFYRKWLSLTTTADSPTDLAFKSFRNSKAFVSNLDVLFRTDRACADETIRATSSIHRFLMKKHFDYELKSSQELWNEFSEAAFRKTPELSDS